MVDFCRKNQQEREQYEYLVAEGKIVHQESGNSLDTSKGLPGAKWIFVLSTTKKLYVGQVRPKLNTQIPFFGGFLLFSMHPPWFGT